MAMTEGTTSRAPRPLSPPGGSSLIGIGTMGTFYQPKYSLHVI